MRPYLPAVGGEGRGGEEEKIKQQQRSQIFAKLFQHILRLTTHTLEKKKKDALVFIQIFKFRLENTAQSLSANYNQYIHRVWIISGMQDLIQKNSTSHG